MARAAKKKAARRKKAAARPARPKPAKRAPPGQVQLSHLDQRGQAHMVDVSAKGATERVAVAEGRVIMSKPTLDKVLEGNALKGDVLGAARLAGTTSQYGTPRNSDMRNAPTPTIGGMMRPPIEAAVSTAAAKVGGTP